MVLQNSNMKIFMGIYIYEEEVTNTRKEAILTVFTIGSLDIKLQIVYSELN